jgi:hypothetical protein
VPQGDEGDVDDRERHIFRQQVGVRVAEVHLFEGDDPRIAQQPVVQQALPHVNRVDPKGAAPEQAVGEAAGRGPHVQRDAPRHVDPEVVERARELPAAPRGERTGGRQEGDPRPLLHGRPAFRADRAFDEDPPGEDQPLGLRARFRDPPGDELGIEPAADAGGQRG